MIANESQSADHDESAKGTDFPLSSQDAAIQHPRKPEFAWYAGHVDDRVLRVIVSLGRALAKHRSVTKEE